MKYVASRYIPKGSVKVQSKKAEAVAYIYQTEFKGPSGEIAKRFYAVIYFGKQSKPYGHFRFSTEAKRVQYIEQCFKSREKSEVYKAAQKKAMYETENPYQVGAIFKSIWGYEQTNVNYYEVIARTEKTVTVREICAERIETSYMQGKCVPLPGQFLERSKAKVCRVLQKGSIKISSCQTAFYMEPELVGGVPVYGASGWTSYA